MSDVGRDKAAGRVPNENEFGRNGDRGFACLNTRDEGVQGLHLEGELHVEDWIWTRGSSVAKFVYGKSGVACMVHGASPGVFRRTSDPGSKIPIFFRVGATMEEELKGGVIFCSMKRLAVDGFKAVSAADGSVCGGSKKRGKGGIEGIDTGCSAERIWRGRRDDLIDRRGMNMVGQISTTWLSDLSWGLRRRPCLE